MSTSEHVGDWTQTVAQCWQHILYSVLEVTFRLFTTLYIRLTYIIRQQTTFLFQSAYGHRETDWRLFCDVPRSQSTGKHSLNSTVFSSWRKATKVGTFLTWVDREFQALAAAAGKARSPSRAHSTNDAVTFAVRVARRSYGVCRCDVCRKLRTSSPVATSSVSNICRYETDCSAEHSNTTAAINQSTRLHEKHITLSSPCDTTYNNYNHYTRLMASFPGQPQDNCAFSPGQRAV